MIIDIVLVVMAALFVGVYVSWRAGRIDRLHARVDMARAALDATLLRRSSVALELATSGLLDPATSLLLASAVYGTHAWGTGGGDLPVAGGPGGTGGGQPPVAGGSGGVVPPRKHRTGRPRDLAESDLTRALRAAFSQPDFRSSLAGSEGAGELLAELEAASHQVFLARKFYNDLVAATRDARHRPLARLLRLSGKAEIPVFFEMDDSLIGDKASASLARPPG